MPRVLTIDRRRGFTLLEMLIVLSILAVLTMVAVQSLAPVEQQARSQATQRTLDNIKSAIINLNQTGGSTVASGFAVDMGFVPDMTSAATMLNDLTLNTTTLGTPRVLFGDVGQAFGWRGPYLQTAVSSSTMLCDSWSQPISVYLLNIAGNPISTLSAASDRIVFVSPGSPVDPTGPLTSSLSFGSLTAMPVTVRVMGMDSTNTQVDLIGTVSMTLQGGIDFTNAASVGQMVLPATAVTGSNVSFQFLPTPTQLLVGPRVLTVTFTSTSMTGYAISSPQTFHMNLIPGTSPSQEVIVCREN